MVNIKAPGWYDTGKKDSLGRPIRNKHSTKRSERISSGDIANVKSDFSSEKEKRETSYKDVSIPITPEAEKVIDALYDKGLQPYLVGGKVRDFLMDKDNKDTDIEVYGVDSTSELVNTLLSCGGDVNIAGESFGVIKYTLNGEEFDVSLPRKDSLKDNSNTHTSINVEVDPDLTEEEASRRRDFTMNALMYNPIEEEIIDFHGGVKDIEDSVLRIVDAETFTDDPLRVLRGVQFSARFDMHPDDEFFELSQTMHWNGLAKERIAGEIHKMLLKSQNLHLGVETLLQSGWSNSLPGIVDKAHNPLDQNVINEINQLENNDIAMAFITSLMDTHYGSNNGDLKDSFMLTSKERNAFNNLPIYKANDVIEASRMRRYLFNKNIDQSLLDRASSALNVQSAQSVWNGKPPSYSVGGKTLIDKGLRPSPAFSSIIQRCQDIEDSGGIIDDKKLDKIIQEETQ